MSRKAAPIKVIKTIFPEDGKVGLGWVYATQLLFLAAERAKAAEAASETGNTSGEEYKPQG